MPDVVGLLGMACNLLGSLNRKRPKDDFEAVKIIDENDPVRCILERMRKEGIPPGTRLFFNASFDDSVELREIFEVGYGAARLRVWSKSSVRCVPGAVNESLVLIRYGAIVRIGQSA